MKLVTKWCKGCWNTSTGVKTMRLIDADALLDKQESLYMKGHVFFHGVTALAIENAPTIDLETLPLVQELRVQVKEQKRSEFDEIVGGSNEH